MCLFRNDCSSRASINRTMPRHAIAVSGRSTVHKGPVSSLRFMEEHVLVSGGSDGYIRIWDCTDLNVVSEVLVLESREGVSALEVPRSIGSGAILLAGSTSGSLHLRDLRTTHGEGDKTAKSENAAAITSITMDDGYILVSGDAKGNIEMRDLRSMRSVPILKLNGAAQCMESKQVGGIPTLPPVAKKSRADDYDDIWSVAMGTKRKTQDAKLEVVEPPRSSPNVFASAHKSAVMTLSFSSPRTIVSVSQDKSIRSFCSITGSLLGSTNLQEKPLTSCWVNGRLFTGARDGVRAYSHMEGVFHQVSTVSNPHIGSVTAACSTGEWGICTGGSDKHIFIHSL